MRYRQPSISMGSIAKPVLASASVKFDMVLIGIILLTTFAEAQENTKPPNGTIYGIAYDSNGHPASQVKLTALPVGVALGTPLPATRTNEKGQYRFAVLPWWGQYTVYADDEDAGYSVFSTGSLGQTEPEEVKIAPAHREGELTVHLPPKAGFLRINLTNGRTGAALPSIRILVMRSTNPPTVAFSSSCSSTQVILLSPEKELLLHVMSDGFQEWHNSVGTGKAIRLASGQRLALDVQLEPSK